MKIRAFIEPHKGESYDSCQDRFAINGDYKKICVSDGMSQSFFPDYWAELLVNAYTSNTSFSILERTNLCLKWKEMVKEAIEKLREEGVNAWRTEAMFQNRDSAGATICGITFKNKTNWEGMVLGDSCIAQCNKNTKQIKLLSSQRGSFNNFPDYIGSYPNIGKGEAKFFSGSIDKDNCLILMSDPFSDYFDTNNEQENAHLVEDLLALSSYSDFAKLVSKYREKGMPDDDSTIVIVEYDDNDTFNIINKNEIKELPLNLRVKTTEITIDAESIKEINKKLNKLEADSEKTDNKIIEQDCKIQNITDQFKNTTDKLSETTETLKSDTESYKAQNKKSVLIATSIVVALLICITFFLWHQILDAFDQTVNVRQEFLAANKKNVQAINGLVSNINNINAKFSQIVPLIRWSGKLNKSNTPIEFEITTSNFCNLNYFVYNNKERKNIKLDDTTYKIAFDNNNNLSIHINDTIVELDYIRGLWIGTTNGQTNLEITLLGNSKTVSYSILSDGLPKYNGIKFNGNITKDGFIGVDNEGNEICKANIINNSKILFTMEKEKQDYLFNINLETR